jgi:hypothetical protein
MHHVAYAYASLLPIILCILHANCVETDSKVRILEELLFPNRSYAEEAVERMQRKEDASRRALRLTPPDDWVPGQAICSNCQGLDKCRVLNGLLVEERYYPTVNIDLGTCTILEALGVRMYDEIFGVGKTFRDTTQCREIVMQYLCLFWGSQNYMYRNYCYWSEDVSDPDPTKHLIAPRPPCRSFCVQVFTNLNLFINF